MIQILVLALFFSLPALAQSERTDLTLNDGTILEGARITAISDNQVSIQHTHGRITVPSGQVPLDVLARAAIELRLVPAPQTQIIQSPQGSTEAPDGLLTAGVPSQSRQDTPSTSNMNGTSGPLPIRTPIRTDGDSKPDFGETNSSPVNVSVRLILVSGAIVVLFLLTIIVLWGSRKNALVKLADLETELSSRSDMVRSLKERYATIIDLEEEQTKITGLLDRMRRELAEKKRDADTLEQTLSQLKKKLALYRDDLEISEFGVYERHYDFDISQRFKDSIEAVRSRQKAMLKDARAFVCDKQWQIEGSRAEGDRMIKRMEKLMLRAFNGESDSFIADVTWNNATRLEGRLDASFDAINKLGESYSCRITRDYYKLKLDELRLTYEYKEKLRAEKEEQRRIQERIRDEERAQREIERALREAEDEESRYQKALEKARAELAFIASEDVERQKRKIAHLEEQLKEAHENRERAVSRAQLTKSGHVYIISNIGSFGENKFKIGMTRRLDPLERVRELGDASVPFDFDVHAVIYTEDAPAFEGRLHAWFAERRVNKINERKEFFEVSIDEIESAVRAMNAEIEIVKLAEARDYRQTLALLTDPERSKIKFDN
jgi:hypothetical protein